MEQNVEQNLKTFRTLQIDYRVVAANAQRPEHFTVQTIEPWVITYSVAHALDISHLI